MNNNNLAACSERLYICVSTLSIHQDHLFGVICHNIDTWIRVKKFERNPNYDHHRIKKKFFFEKVQKKKGNKSLSRKGK